MQQLAIMKIVGDENQPAATYSEGSTTTAFSDAMQQVSPQQENATKSSSITQGWQVFTASLSFLVREPLFALPILATWIIVAAIVLYLRYFFDAAIFGSLVMPIIFGVIFLISYIICLANLLLLELLQQKENNQPISLAGAFRQLITLDALKAIVTAFFFAIIWFFILLLRAATSKRRSASRPQPSLQDAAQTLGGSNANPFSWFGLGLEMIEKLLRMTVFLSLPAIAWENEGPISAFKTAFSIIKAHPVQFLTDYSLTYVASVIMALPLVIVIGISKADISLPAAIWIGVIIYEGITWTLGLYLEQMTVAQLYLWHLRWIKNGSQGDLSSVPQPNVLA